MRKSVVTVLTLALACAGLSLFVGCETSEQQADHVAQAAVAAAEVDRAKANGLDDLDKVQNTYDRLATDATLSPQMQVLVRARQAQLRLERTNMRISLLRAQELDIERNIEDIERLGSQIAAAQSSIDALKEYEPTDQINKLKAQQAAIQGSADKLTWDTANSTADNSQGASASPTLFAVSKEIDTLSGAIQQNQSDSDTERKTSVAKGDEAETYARRAEGETGDQQVADTTKSAEDRRDAAIADTHSDALKVQLARLQADLDRAKSQQASLQAAIQSLDSQIAALQTRWTSINEQIQAQMNIQHRLIDGDTGDSASLAGLVQDLSAQIGDTNKQRDSINTELAAVIPQLQAVIQKCGMLRTQWITDVQTKQDDPDVIIWKQAMETLHPAYFNMQMATALQVKASVAAAKTHIDKMIIDMFDGYSLNPGDMAANFKSLDIATGSKAVVVPGLTALLDPSKTGVPTKDIKALGDISSAKLDPDAFKQSVDDVNADYDAAVQAFSSQQFGATDSGSAASDRRNVGLVGLAAANRDWANFAQLIGDSAGADNHRHAADDAESQIYPDFRQLVISAPAPTAPAVPGTPASGTAQ